VRLLPQHMSFLDLPLGLGEASLQGGQHRPPHGGVTDVKRLAQGTGQLGVGGEVAVGVLAVSVLEKVHEAPCMALEGELRITGLSGETDDLVRGLPALSQTVGAEERHLRAHRTAAMAAGSPAWRASSTARPDNSRRLSGSSVLRPLEGEGVERVSGPLEQLGDLGLVEPAQRDALDPGLPAQGSQQRGEDVVVVDLGRGRGRPRTWSWST
jgi:hypothetical protein